MSCCCGTGYCTTRRYDDGGNEDWQAPGLDSPNSARADIALDSSGNAYTVSGGVEKLNTSGVRVYLTANDGRFGNRSLRTICTDPNDTHGYVGSSHECPGPFGGGFTGPNVFKILLADGSVVASASIGTCAIEINDCCPDGSGGVYFATTEGIFHFDSDFEELDPVGCATNVAAVAIDGDDNLWAAGGSCPATVDGCPVNWTVRKYVAGVLTDGHTFPSPSALEVAGDFVYVGFRESNDPGTPCNVVKFDRATFDCEWSARVGPTSPIGDNSTAAVVRDIAVAGGQVYPISGDYLFALDDSDGSFEWCRKNEGLEGDGVTKKRGRLYAVAATTDYVWVTGQATPCNDAEESACDQGSCDNDSCDCDCGTVGRRGGTLVKGCGCDEVPCEFDVPVTSDCEALDGEEIHWQRTEDVQTWQGTLSFTCGEEEVVIVFTATNDCEQEETGGWTLDATISEGYTITTTILNWWCADDAPDGQTFPGFSGTFTITGLGDCCDETVEACFNFDPNGSTCSLGVDTCGCTGLPETIYADVTGAHVGTVAMAWDGTSKFVGTFTEGGCDFQIVLECVDPETRSFKTTISTENEDCSVCNNSDSELGVVAECSPFSLTTSVPVNGAGGACPFWESGGWGVEYYE